MTKNYTQLLEDLKDGKIDKLEITTEEFMDFQREYMNFGHRKNVVGTAKRNGGAIYHYPIIKKGKGFQKKRIF